ncbi:cysteine peptidase family C39 domain-containing protein [Niabella sp. CJ426]|uniref:cysteine peptidase family C39 domain-containing protein n=1 Tax=Niabella sp. CJ426 TaxID=3393740 RepID=UPI003D0656DA
MIFTFPNDRQFDIMDCGPACLKMIAKHYGKYYSLQYLRDKCGTTKEGASFLDLSHAAEAIGLRSLSLKINLDFLITKVPLPVIVHWDNSHFVIVYKTNPKTGSIYVSDPAKGRIKYSSKEFSKKWIKNNADGDNGMLMAFEPQADFHQRNISEKLNRKKTFGNFLNYFKPYKKSFAVLLVVMFIVT